MRWARIIDVNVNRLSESLKLIEDISRFSLNNKELLATVRNIRNDFLKVKKTLPLTNLISSRESQHDLGRAARFDIHMKKTSGDVIVANFTRAKESSRILEETLKSFNVPASIKMKKIRFKIYDIEQHILQSLRKKFNPRLYAIIDEKYIKPAHLSEMVHVLENNGVTMIQLRITTLTDRKFINYAATIRKALHNPATKFIVNNRTDIALAAHADGVHLGLRDMPIKTARTIAGEQFIVGASAHNVQEALSVEAEGADYIGVGSVFKTTTKPDARVCGIRVLKSICKKVTIPVVGIGGITNKNYRAVLKAGAAGIAVCSYLFEGAVKKNVRSLTSGKS